ncbi:MAG: hypothetical protein FP816_19170 [Desulfobacteraceae bacterium]|nr:hypothetical protein [Desulfobacteraceae bacterium]
MGFGEESCAMGYSWMNEKCQIVKYKKKMNNTGYFSHDRAGGNNIPLIAGGEVGVGHTQKEPG